MVVIVKIEGKKYRCYFSWKNSGMFVSYYIFVFVVFSYIVFLVIIVILYFVIIVKFWKSVVLGYYLELVIKRIRVMCCKFIKMLIGIVIVFVFCWFFL